MDQFQRANHTFLMREAEVLRAAGKHLGRTRPLNILSFGCSIGDELATLRMMFPNASIQGCDIDPSALALAREAAGDSESVFLSEEGEIERRGPYDLVVAFSSLCIHPAPRGQRFAEAFPFSRFEEIVALFASVLREGGVLAVQNTSYLVKHTAAASRFDVLRPDNIVRNGFIDVRGPDGSVIVRSAPSPIGTVHRIVSAQGIDDWDLVDCLFVRDADTAVREPRVRRLRLFAPRPGLELRPLKTWRRSDLDTLPPEKQLGHVRLTRAHQAFIDGDQRVWLQSELYRSRLKGGEDLRTGIVGLERVG